MLDEADRLLELGFKAEVEEIVSACPTSLQTLLFSATISEEVARLASGKESYEALVNAYVEAG